MIRVLFDPEIFALQNRGGIPNFFRALFLEFKENPQMGIEPLVPKGPWFPHWDVTASTPVRYSNFRRVARLLESQVSLLASQPQADLLHASYYSRFRYRGSAPTVVTIHDVIAEKNEFPVSTFSRLIDKLSVARNSIGVAFDSVTAQAEFHEVNKFRHRTEKVIYLGVKSATSTRPPVPTPPWPYLLYVGNRSTYKQFNLLVDAIWILNAYGVQVNLIAAGGEYPRKREITLPQNSTFTHMTPDDSELGWLYSHASATVVTSADEGFGLPVLEAKLYGSKVIASDIPVFKELHGSELIYFRRGNAFELSQRIKNVWAEQSGGRGLPTMTAPSAPRPSLSWKDTAREYADFYRAALEETLPNAGAPRLKRKLAS